MTDLNQQLEDKKKEQTTIGCGWKPRNWEQDDWYECGVDDYLCDDCEKKKITLEAEIAILEQAIAEIKKRDKEELDLLKTIKKWICKVTPEMQLDNEILREVCPNIFYNCENRTEQLQSQQLKVEVSESEKIVRGTPRADTPQDEIKSAGLVSSSVVSNLLQKQRQEIVSLIDKLPKKILNQEMTIMDYIQK